MFQIVTPKIKSRDEHDEIMKIFDLFDEDGTGEISFRNLKRVAVRARHHTSSCDDRGCAEGGAVVNFRLKALLSGSSSSLRGSGDGEGDGCR